MAKSLPANVILETRKLHTKSAWIVLCAITLPDNTIVRLARNTADISYGGNTFTAANFNITQSGSAGQGEIPTWQLEVENVTRLLSSHLESQNGMVGSTITITVVNSELLSESYAELEKTFSVLGTHITATVVSLTLGAPNLLRQRFPLRRHMARHCQWHFSWDGGECSYAPSSIASVDLSGTSPVRVKIANHSIDDGEPVDLESVAGITPTLNAEFTASYIDANYIDLVGTDSSDYSGSYTGGGRGGYAACPRTLRACYRRINQTRFGGHPGLREGGLRLA